jgi:hypothetical protein
MSRADRGIGPVVDGSSSQAHELAAVATLSQVLLHECVAEVVRALHRGP